MAGFAELPDPNFEYITSTEEALKTLEEIEKYSIIEVDTETTGLDPLSDRVTLFQLGVQGKSWVYDVRDGRVDCRIFKAILESSKAMKILQHARFDYQMLKTNFGISIRRLYDTMLGEQLLYLGLNPKASLQVLVQKYLNMDMPKEASTSFVGRYDQEYQEYQLKYAANDVGGYLTEIYNQQLAKLREDNLLRVMRLECEFVRPLAEMELRGIILDTNKWGGIIDEQVVERDRLRIQLGDVMEEHEDQTTLFGVSLINIDSPSQILKRLRKMGVPLETTDFKELNKYKKHPVVKQLLEYRKFAKFVTTYGEPLLDRIHKNTGRLHSSFQQMVDTGRLSSRKPNLQNIPGEQKYRSCFVAKPGYKLITCDMSGAELRIIGDMSGEPKWVAIFKDPNQDLHTMSAADIFGVTVEEVIADKKLKDDDPNKKFYRDRSKPLSFGLAYGLTKVGLALRLGIPEKEAQNMISVYFKTYPRVKPFLERISKEAINKRYSISNSGRRRYYHLPDKTDPDFGKIKSSIERKAKNMPIQAGNADTIKQAIIYAEDRLEEYDAEVILTVHDEIVVEVVEEQAEEVSEIVSQCMVDGFAEFYKIVPMVAESSINDYWKK